MKCIILVAGYATRLYPLTKNQPKALLQVAGKTILDHIMEKVETVGCIEDVILVSNDKFYTHFTDWKDTYNGKKAITVLNDHTLSNEDRLGAIRDIMYAVDTLAIDKDCLILAGDNLFDFELNELISFYQGKKTDVITTHIIENKKELQRTGVVELDEESRVRSFEEKPKEPKSTYAVPPFYLYKKETLPLIRDFIEENNNGDAPGMLLSWLVQKVPVHAYHFKGKRYDIGTMESYEDVKRIYGE